MSSLCQNIQISVKGGLVKSFYSQLNHLRKYFKYKNNMTSTSTVATAHDIRIKYRRVRLAEGTLESVTDCEFPSYQQVLCHFCHLHMHEKNKYNSV